MNSVETFSTYHQEYDRWFEEHPVLFKSELEALDKVIPHNKYGIELGVGTGRFEYWQTLITASEHEVEDILFGKIKQFGRRKSQVGLSVVARSAVQLPNRYSNYFSS